MKVDLYDPKTCFISAAVCAAASVALIVVSDAVAEPLHRMERNMKAKFQLRKKSAS